MKIVLQLSLAVLGASWLLAAGPGPVLPEAMQAVSFDGLDAKQKDLAVAILNEASCDCGCGMKVAVCRRDDSKCGRSKALAEQTIAAIKAGKSRDEIAKAIYSPPSKFVQFPLVPGGAPSIGPANARVTILHYTDFQCPFCARVSPAIERLLADYPNDVRVVYKMHPLSIHPNAPRAAAAALAAHAQGKFAAMQHKLFEHQADLSRETILGVAREIGLDVDRFTKDLDGNVHAAEIASDTREVEALGATGTPATFVNGRFVNGAKPYEFFRAMVDEEIAWAKAGHRPKFTTGTNVSQTTAAAPVQGPDATKVYKLPAGDAPARGPADAKVTILHYLDYQCPVCVRVHPTIEQVVQAYPADVRIVYKMHPLSSIHPNAMIAAEAALAAHAQGKFLEMHRRLFDLTRELTRDKILVAAKEIGLDVERFTKDLDGHAFRAAIDAQTKEVMDIGATGTPTSFVNGRFVLGAQPFENFKQVIDAELAKAKAPATAAK